MALKTLSQHHGCTDKVVEIKTVIMSAGKILIKQFCTLMCES